MALHDDIRLLTKVPLFEGMNDDQMRLLAFGAERRHVSQGQSLFRESSPAECAYVVASGRFALTALGRDGKTSNEGFAGPGVLLSELALVTLVERKFTAIATEDAEAIRITRALFHRLMEEYPAVSALIESRIRDNIARMVESLSSMTGHFA